METKQTERILDEIADDFNFFLLNGVRFDSFAREIDPNLNINDIQKLLRIHFVLTEGVIEFVNQLSGRIRLIKTSTTKETCTQKDIIRGRIDWAKTLRTRYNTNPRDENLFVCSMAMENYDINENIILKKLLQIIHDIIFNDLKPAIDNDYEWIGDWAEKKELKKNISDIYLKNIYIKRIDSKKLRVTERMISSASKSRHALYREAADLLRRYNHLINYDLNTEETKELLRNTFIRPDKIEILFELYWVIKILKEYKDRAHIRFNLIEGTPKTVIASWNSSEYTYRMYHNSTGGLQLNENLRDVEEPETDGYLSRELKAMKKLSQIGNEIFDVDSRDTLWGGRPDIIIEKQHSESKEIKQVFIGEVKYTDNKNYAMKGLRELLEYMALIKVKESGEYIQKLEDIFESEQVKGGLFINDVKIKEGASIPNIKIKKFGDEVSEVCI